MALSSALAPCRPRPANRWRCNLELHEAEGVGMSAATVGAQMPAQVTLDDLAAMSAADGNHHYELSIEGVLSVMPPADPDHALLVTWILAWFLTNGFGPERIVVDC